MKATLKTTLLDVLKELHLPTEDPSLYVDLFYHQLSSSYGGNSMGSKVTAVRPGNPQFDHLCSRTDSVQ